MAEGVLTSAEINPSELPRFHMLSLHLHQRLLGIISRVLSKHLAQNGEIGFILLITEPSSRKISESVCALKLYHPGSPHTLGMMSRASAKA